MAAPPIAPPALLVYSNAVLLDQGYIDVGVADAGSPLPEDFTLQELLHLDVTAPEALLEVIVRYGAIAHVGPTLFQYLPSSETWRGPFPEVIAATEAYATRTDRHPGFIVSVEALRLHLRAARAMSRHFLAHREGEDVRASWVAEGFYKPRSTAMAWNWWTDHMNAALAPFRMYVQYSGPRGDRGPGLPQPTLHSACGLQLAQYLATDARVLFCANERCRKPFTRQRAPLSRRRNADQFHTSGVLYCSRECLKRKSEQDRRDRRKAEGQQGTS